MCERESETETVRTDRSSNSTSCYPIKVTRPEPREGPLMACRSHSSVHAFDFCNLLAAIANRFSSILTLFNAVVLVLVYKERVE
jgi:hypothetical protein